MCAEACLHHRWLRRKGKAVSPAAAKPKVPQVPVAPEPPPQPAVDIVVDIVVPADKAEVNNNIIAEPEVNNNSVVVADKNAESKVPAAAAQAADAGNLAGAKDNLRNIVERWTEHPDGPYIFDTETHTISPCPSLASVLTEPDAIAAGAVHMAADEVTETAKELVASTPTSPTSPTATLPLPYDRLLGSERRASDSNCLVRLKSHHLDIHDRINLADEIRKLSEKLFRMASWAPHDAGSAVGAGGAKPAVSPLAVPSGGDNVEATTVTETKKGCTTTKTTFKSSSTTSNGTTTVTSSTTTTTRRAGERGAGTATPSRLTENFTVRAVQTQIPTKRFWPIEPGRMPSRAELKTDLEDMTPTEEAAALAGSLARRDSRRLSIPGREGCEGRDTRESRDASAFRRLTSRSLSSASSGTATHSAPQSPRWSPDPELPPPPTSDITKDLVLRLLHRLDSVPSAATSAASTSLASHHSLLSGLRGLAHWQDDPFFRPKTTAANSLLEKKRTLIASHSGGV